MTNDRKYDEAFGVDMPFGEALERFGAVTKEELAETQEPGAELVVDGQLEIVAFKGREIRRSLHDGEWMFSIVDVVAALTDSDRPSRYWTDLRSKMSKNEGF